MTEAQDTKNPSTRNTSIWVRLWPLYLIAGAIAVVFVNGWHRVLSLETLRSQREVLTSFVSENLVLALAMYLGVYIAATALMLPGAMWITIAGGFLFGLASGSVATTIGATLGASILFFAARSSIGVALKDRAGPFVRRMEKGFAQDAFSYMFALRFMPVVPFPVANIAPALLGARYAPYAFTTAVGILPGVLAYTWLGAGLGDVFDSGEALDISGFFGKLAPAFAALGVVALLPVAYKRFRGGKAAPMTTED